MSDPVNAESTQKDVPGVTGLNKVGGAGVFGLSPSGPGVEGLAVLPEGVGVLGTNPNPPSGIGVKGIGFQGSIGPGVPGGTGVQGIGAIGIHGRGGTAGLFEGNVTVNGSISSTSDSGPAGFGVLGVASQNGTDHDPAKGGTGVLGTGYIGVRGETQTGAAIFARVFGNGLAGLFRGQVRVEGGAEVTGVLAVDGDVSLKNHDLAEQFEASVHGEPGSVMIIGDNGQIAPCNRTYDKRAVGVVSGAGPLKPAITLGDRSGAPGITLPIAMIGTVYCLVDADRSPIEVGDLLTSADTVGHAMKALDQAKSFGAVIGKALAPLGSGRGLIPIVVALQ